MMSNASSVGQDGVRSQAEFVCEDQAPAESEDCRCGTQHRVCFKVYRGLALVDCVGPNFGTAIFNCAGKEERLFFFKNKVFVDGKKVTSKVILMDVLSCDTVVAFEAVPYRNEQYDVSFRGNKIDVTNLCVAMDKLSPAVIGCSNTYTDGSLWEPTCLDINASVQVMRNHSAGVKYISKEGGVLDYVPEIRFYCNVVCITEFVEGIKSLPSLIPVGTVVNFDAVIKGSGIEITCLWTGDKPTDISLKEFEGATNSNGLVKGRSGIVERYTSAVRGRVEGFKIQGQKMIAIFHRKDVYFPKPSEMALNEYLPVGTLVHFDGKLVVSETHAYVKVSFLWCGKRPDITLAPSCEQLLPRDHLDSVSSVETSASSLGTNSSDTSVLNVSRKGTVSRYVSENEGIICCAIFGKESEVHFHRSDVHSPSKMDEQKSLSVYFPVGSTVYFTAEMFTTEEIVVKTLKLVQEPDNSALLNVDSEPSTCANPVQVMSMPDPNVSESMNVNSDVLDKPTPLSVTNEILNGRCGIVKYYNSPSEGVLECTINGVKRDILFRECFVLLEPQLCHKKLLKALPIGTSVNFDAKVIMLDGCWQYVAKIMWIKKKPKLEALASNSVISENGGVVLDTSTETVLHNRAAKVKCFISSTMGIVEFSFEGTLKEAVFHKDVVYIPKDVNVCMEDYLTVGRNVFFDGRFEHGNSGRLIIASLWAEKRKTLQPPRVVVEAQAGGSTLDIGEESLVFDSLGASGLVSAGSEERSRVSISTEECIAENIAKTSGDCKIRDPTFLSIKGFTAWILSYTSEYEGIIQCTIFKIMVTATFHKNVVYIPGKAKNLTLKEYLPIGKPVYFDAEVTVSEDLQSVQPIVTVTQLWGGKKPKQHIAENPIQLTTGSVKLLQSKVYEAEVVYVDRICFTASISQDGSKIPVIVWNQFFRPSLMCEESLRAGELVSLHVCIGDKVFLRVVRNYGRSKDKFEWCACDAWKDSNMAHNKQVSVDTRNYETKAEGTVVWLDEVSALIWDETNGLEVAFRRENALLFGISLAAFDLANIFKKGDSLFYVLADEVEASKVWFDSCTIDGTRNVFMKVSSFCQERSIPLNIMQELVNQLCRQSSKEGAGSLASRDVDKYFATVSSGNQQLVEETVDVGEDGDYLIYVSSSASTASDSDSEGVASCEDEPSPMVDLYSTKVRENPLALDVYLSEDEPLSFPHMDLHSTKNKQSSLEMDLYMLEDKPTSALTADFHLATDKPTNPLVKDLHLADDKPVSAVAMGLHLTEDRPRSLEIDLHLTKNKPSDLNGDEQVSSATVNLNSTKDKQSPLEMSLLMPEDKSTSPLVKDLHLVVDKPVSDGTMELHVSEGKPVSPVATDLCSEDKPNPPTIDMHLTEDRHNSVAMDLHSTVDMSADSVVMNVQSAKDEPTSVLTMESHVKSLHVGDYYYSSDFSGSFAKTGNSPSCGQVEEINNCSLAGDCTCNKSFIPVLQSSLETVLKSRGIEIQLCHEFVSEVMVLVHQEMGLGGDIPHRKQPSWSGSSLAASGSESGLDVGRSEQGSNVTCVERCAQTTSTGRIISLHYLP